MEKVTIRNSVRKEIANIIPTLINNTLEWIKNKYPNVDFSKVEYIFSSNYNRSRYFRNELKDAKYMAPNVCISTRATLYLYDKKSLKMKKTSLYTGSNVQIMCALIHELTHHVQHEQKRSRGELETTENELLYLKENYPLLYNKIMN
jgi:hypothetical protein